VVPSCWRATPAATEFWSKVFGRPPDLQPGTATSEWRVLGPQVTLRIRLEAARAGGAHVGLGVPNVDQVVGELRERGVTIGDVLVKPGIIYRHRIEFRFCLRSPRRPERRDLT
jgi:catechol 2,3-dioxygenase-like lactoylglutathione lyase family enzyme